MENLLTRQYYEYDNAFYKYKANISCWEQMQYQSLRSENIDYFLAFCDDINVYFNPQKNLFGTCNLGYNNQLYDFILVTRDAQDAENSILRILDSGKIVVFQTAMDYLQTSCWYHKEPPYNALNHYSILIGYDTNHFFYVDSPPMRNPQFFIKHPANNAVGIIHKQELLNSFQYHCKIGYININKQFIGCIADIEKIMDGISKNYYSNELFTGKYALLNLAEYLCTTNCKSWLLNDSFKYELIISRHKRLKMNLLNYSNKLLPYNLNTIISSLDLLIHKWGTVKYFVMKYQTTFDEKILFRISNILINEIIKIMENMLKYFPKQKTYNIIKSE